LLISIATFHVFLLIISFISYFICLYLLHIALFRFFFFTCFFSSISLSLSIIVTFASFADIFSSLYLFSFLEFYYCHIMFVVF